MEAVLLLSLLSAISLLLLFKLVNSYRCSPKHNLPPGPKPWPIIGNLNLNLIGPILHQSFHALSKTHGELMHLKFGSTPVVVASSAEMAKELLQTHDHIFASRPTTAAGKYTAYNYSDMSWAPYGPYWRQARRIYLTEIFTPKRLQSSEHIRIEERRALFSRLHAVAAVGKSVLLRENLTRYTLSSISRMVMGYEYFTESNSEKAIVGQGEFQEMLDEWILLNGVLNLGDWIPWLGFLDLQGYVKKMKGLYRRFERFYNHVLNDHKARREEGRFGKDMVDVLLELADDHNLEVKLTSDRVKGLLQDLLAGGTDTSATAIEWAILEILKQPHILQKATHELDTIIGRDKWVEDSNFSHLPYLEAIIKETLRLHPLATLLAPHLSLQDCKISGYDILKGTVVFVNAWSIGKDPRYWVEPERFWPERFLGRDIDVKGQNFELLPFGSGRRRCPGYRLGLIMVRSTLANLLHGFDWKLSGNMKPKDICMDELYGLTTRPKVSLIVNPKPRLPAHLY